MSEFTRKILSARDIDAAAFWRSLGQRASPVAIVTADNGGKPAGFFALSAAHVSADPPTMLASIDRKTAALEVVLAARHFAVNYLSAGQQKIAEAFAGKTAAKGAARFTAGHWTTLQTGAPILEDAVSAFDCTLDQVIERQNTVIVIGLVAALAFSENNETLIYCSGSYR